MSKNFQSIYEPAFEEAFVDNKYVKKDVTNITNDLIHPESLADSDETALHFIFQNFNDMKTTNVSVMNVIKAIEKGKSSPSNEVLLSKLKSNNLINQQYQEYLSKKKSEDKKWRWSFIAFIVVSALWIANNFGYLSFPKFGSGSKIVVIDMDKLATTATVNVMNNKLSPDQALQYANSYHDNLEKIVNSYLDQGYVIMNSNLVFAEPKDVDITDNIIKKLGMTPVSRKDFDKNYSNAQKFNVISNFANQNIENYGKGAKADALDSANKTAEKQFQKQEVYTNDNGQSIDIQ